MCSNCAGDYEDPDATAYETPVKPYVGWPALETQNQSLLYELLLSAYEAQQKEKVNAEHELLQVSKHGC